MAVQRVEELLRKVATALDAAGIPYAVVGGNAVAAWVATIDQEAVRATKDVDILLRRDDLAAAADALRPHDLIPVEVMGVHMFVERARPSPRTGVHVIIAGEPITWADKYPAPDLTSVERTGGGFTVIDLYHLVFMKLQACRPVDRTHIEDLLGMGLVTEDIVRRLPDDLRARFAEIREEWQQRQMPGSPS
jgi:hypothetical protein